VCVEGLHCRSALRLDDTHHVGVHVLDDLGRVLASDLGEFRRLELDGPVPVGLSLRLHADDRPAAALEELAPIFTHLDEVFQVAVELEDPLLSEVRVVVFSQDAP